MSIIHDALKKAQDKLGEHKKRILAPKQPPSPTPPPVKNPQLAPADPPVNPPPTISSIPTPTPAPAAPVVDNQTAPSRPTSLPTGFILGITLLFAVILVYALSQAGNKSPVSLTPTPAEDTPPVVKPVAKFPTKLILGGTVILDNKRAAIINDNVYETGGVVDGKKIISISLEKVELQDERGNITLLTPGKN